MNICKIAFYVCLFMSIPHIMTTIEIIQFLRSFKLHHSQKPYSGIITIFLWLHKYYPCYEYRLPVIRRLSVMNYELYMYFINLMDRVKQFGFLLLIICNLMEYFSFYLYHQEIRRYRKAKTKDRKGVVNAVRMLLVSSSITLSTLLMIFLGNDISVIISVIINIIILIIIIFIGRMNFTFEDEYQQTESIQLSVYLMNS